MRVFSFPFGKKKVPSPLELRQAQLLEDLTETPRQLAAALCLSNLLFAAGGAS